MGNDPGGPERPLRRTTGAWLRRTLLVLLVIAGGALRLHDLNWDQFQHVHPDERFIVWVADTMSRPESVAVALDPERSPINPFRWPPADPASGALNSLAGQPRNYAYGHFPLYLLVATAHVAQSGASWLGETTHAFPAAFQPLHTVGRRLAGYHYLPLVGRAISSLADLGTLLLVYAAARLLVGSQGRLRAAGPLLAAGAYAFAVLPIQLSHFVAVDALLTFLVTATVLLAAHWARQSAARENGVRNELHALPVTRHSWLVWLLAGALAGLAIGSKFSAVLLAIPLSVAALHGLPAASRGRQAWVVIGRLAAVGSAALLVFAATNPFALLEFDAYVRQIVAQNAMVSGAMDAPYTRQYIGTLPYLYFIQQLSQWGLGWPLGIVAWGGLVWATVVLARRRSSPALTVMLAWALPYLATTGAFHTKFLRYMAPLLPFLLAFGVLFALAGCEAAVRRWGGRGRVVCASAIVITGTFTVVWALTFLGVYRQEHPWIQASRWIYQNIPSGSKLLTEHWDDALPLALDEYPGAKPQRREYVRVELPMWDTDAPEKLDLLVAELSTADFIILASDRLATPLPRLPVRYPMTSHYYRLLFGGDLGYRVVAEFTAYPRLGPLLVRDDRADESFYVYDHPRVLVLENVERLSASLLRARLGRYLPLGMGPSDVSNRAAHPERSGAESKGAERPAREAASFDWTAPSLRSAQDAGAVPGRAGRAPGLARLQPQAPAPDAPLTLPQPVDTLPVVADLRWNRAASEWAPFAVILWWLAISLFGWLAWPLIFPLLGGLRDRGFGLARAAGWLLVGWLHWIGVSLGAWQNRVGPLVGILSGLAVLGVIAWLAQRRQIGALWAERRALILGQEALFLGAYLAFVGVRLLNPDLWQPWNGGEKFMEFAFLNAILRSPVFPPYDPYFAGGIINYYYYGLYLVSLPIKLTGIFSEVAFNLAAPSLFALTATGVFSVAYSLTPRGRKAGGGGWSPRRTALVSVVMALLMGNLRGLGWLADLYVAFLRSAPLPRYDYWAASRVIPYTINEFPLWTFTFADLHPHLIAMPFGILVVGLALNWLSVRERAPVNGAQEASSEPANKHTARRRIAALVPAGLLLCLSLGALGAINTWDLPTYTLLVAAAILLAGWRARGWRALLGGAGLAILIGAVAVGAYWPFYAHYQAQVGGGDGSWIGRFLAWTRESSPLGPWLAVWGFHLVVASSYVVAALLPTMQAAAGRGTQREAPSGSGRSWLPGLLGVIAVLAVLAAAERPTAAIAVLPLCLALPLILRRRAAPAAAFTGLLLVLGLGIVAGTELVYLRDFLEGGEWYRMNTLFKFSVPAWLLLSVAGGLMMRQAWSAAGRAPTWIRLPWRAMVCTLLAGSLVFLAVGIRARVADRFPGERPAVGTLDATAYMTVGRYTWPGASDVIVLRPERDAIHWLLENVSGTPVIAEAPAGGYQVGGQFAGYDYYRAGGLRVASLTGLPTFVGQHQYEQRPGDQVGLRTNLGQEFFRTTDIARTKDLIRELRVGYIYVGQLERILFSEQSLQKYDAMVELGDLTIVYSNPQVTIYRVTL